MLDGSTPPFSVAIISPIFYIIYYRLGLLLEIRKCRNRKKKLLRDIEIKVIIYYDESNKDDDDDIRFFKYFFKLLLRFTTVYYHTFLRFPVLIVPIQRSKFLNLNRANVNMSPNRNQKPIP